MILRGLWRLTRLDRAGIGEFGGTLDHFYTSLAPLIAFPLAGALLAALQGDWRVASIGLLSRLVAVLALPAIIYEFARLFGREAYWLRAATILNWSFWMFLPALLLASLIGGIIVQAGQNMQVGEGVTLLLAGIYMLFFRVFALSAALGLRAWQALLIVLASSIAISLALTLPEWPILGLTAQMTGK